MQLSHTFPVCSFAIIIQSIHCIVMSCRIQWSDLEPLECSGRGCAPHSDYCIVLLSCYRLIIALHMYSSDCESESAKSRLQPTERGIWLTFQLHWHCISDLNSFLPPNTQIIQLYSLHNFNAYFFTIVCFPPLLSNAAQSSSADWTAAQLLMGASSQSWWVDGDHQ